MQLTEVRKAEADRRSATGGTRLVFDCLSLLVCLDLADHPSGIRPTMIMECYAGLQAVQGAGRDVFLR